MHELIIIKELFLFNREFYIIKLFIEIEDSFLVLILIFKLFSKEILLIAIFLHVMRLNLISLLYSILYLLIMHSFVKII